MSYIYNKEDFTTLTPTKVVELEPSFLLYNKELELLICSTCSLAIISTKGISKHLKEKHSSTKVTKETLSTLESNSIKSYLDLDTRVPYNTYYFKDLPLILNGYTCFKCSFITTSYKKYREHLIKVEGIKGTSTKKREDISTTPLQILYPSLNKGLFIPKLPDLGLNTLIEAREASPSFLTTRRSTSPSASSTSSTKSNEEDIPSSNNLYLDYKTKKEELSNKAKEIGEATISEKALSSFLKNSRFNLFLEGRNIKDLLELISPIPKEDILLESLYSISYNLSYKISTLIPNILRFIRIDIKRDSTLSTFLNNKDFIELESNTKKTYFKVFSNLLVFIIRLYLIDNNLRPSSNKDYISKDIDLSIDLNTNVKALLEKNETYILRNDNETLKDIETLIIYIFNELVKIPIKFTTLKEFNLFRNPTISFFILNTLEPTSFVFKDTRAISKLASILIYNTRLYIIGYLSTIEEKGEENTYNLEEEYNTLSSNYLKSTSKNYLGEIINIRNYTLKISKELVSKNRPILELDSNRLLVYNKEYSITSLSTLFKDLIFKLKDILFNDLIGLDINTLPSINLSTIRDNPLLKNLDYSLLDSPNLIDYKDYLVKLVLEPKSKLNKRYIRKVSDNKPYFNISNTTKFLSRRKEFIELLTLALYLTTSSPLRGEELIRLTYKNTRDNIRNIIFSKEEELIVITTSYYKSYNITILAFQPFSKFFLAI